MTTQLLGNGVPTAAVTAAFRPQFGGLGAILAALEGTPIKTEE